MTIETTIKVLSNERACVVRQTEGGCDRKCEGCDLVLPDRMVLSAYGTAIDILLSQQEREKNEPLTMDELRRMDGKPVFVENRGRFRKRFRDEWAVVDDGNKKVSSVWVNYHYCHYGKTWIAYRRKPEEAEE